MTGEKLDFLKWNIQSIYERHPMALKNTYDEFPELEKWEENTGNSIWVEVELFTGDISASSFQIIKSGHLTVEPERVYQELKTKSIFDVRGIADWYQSAVNCPKTKLYVELINYWRLLLVEYLDELAK